MSYTGLIDGDTVSLKLPLQEPLYTLCRLEHDKTVNLTYSRFRCEQPLEIIPTTGQVTTPASILANDNVLDFDGSDDYIRLMSASGGFGTAFDFGNRLYLLLRVKH